MKIKFPFQLFIVLALCISACSVDVSPPAISTPILSASPTLPVGAGNATASVMTTTVPITWAGLKLEGRLVYTSPPLAGDVSFFISIQSLDLTTGEITPIFTTTGYDWIFYMSVSPDAKQLVMSYMPPTQSGSSSSRALYIMPLDATVPPQPLFLLTTPDDQYIQAEWSPDGKYIYYVHYNTTEQAPGEIYPTYELLRMAYPDGQAEKVAEKAFWPRLSADSSKLVYVSLDPASGTNELFVANADGSDPQKISLSGPAIPRIIDAPIFSPDGQSILFSAPPPPQAYQPNWLEKLMGIKVARAHSIPSDWWSVPVTGGEVIRLTQIQTINLFASISLDHSGIASVSGEGLFTMDLDGSDLTQLLFTPGVSGTVSWIP